MKKLIYVIFLFAVGLQVSYAKPKNVTFRMQFISVEHVDNGAPGLSIGDFFVTRGEIYDINTNEKIGSYVTRRLVLSYDPASGTDERDNKVKLILPNGTILIEGMSVYSSALNTTAHSSSDPIVGGTEYYSGAKGQSNIIVIDAAKGVFHNQLIFK